MTDQKQFVAFYFSHVGRQPRTLSELRNLPWLNLQRRMIQHWASANNYHLAHTLFKKTTNTETAFTESLEFRTALRRAGELKCSLVMADISESLSRTPAEKIVGCVKALDSILVDIWDVRRNDHWRSLSLEMRNNLMNRAVTVRVSREKAIRNGLRTAATRKKPSADNGKRGNSANQAKADAFARELAGFVGSQKAKLTPDAKISPSALAHALNEAGVLSPRSGLWKHNSAKNLLERVEKLNPS
ncbi:hypothetical protein NKI09_05065 [Mesorhizobium sp. M0757]|uniref:hypothetical protein n=1 Tax=Mesorhizobium sp. M0757 TaxID=2956993 RepID=UPI0033376D9C